MNKLELWLGWEPDADAAERGRLRTGKDLFASQLSQRGYAKTTIGKQLRAIADLSREETLAFLGLDDQTGAAALAAV